jgi:hypothetical protein
MKKLLFILSISLFTITAFSQGIYNNGGYIVTTSGANIYVDGGTSGGYTSAGTSYVQGNASSTLTLEGNFTNNSSTTGFINPNNVTTVFNAVAQNIGGSASTTFGNVTVSGTGTKRIDVSTAVNDLFLNGQVLFLNGFTLTIDGVISGGGSILGGQTSNLNITSASALTTGIPLQQLALNNLTMSRNNGASLSSAVELYGTLSISNGTLTTNGNLTLISNQPIKKRL